MTSETTVILPGAKGADFVALTDRVKAWLLANQIRFVVRYVVPANYTSIGKDYREWETAWYHENGIAVLPNFERSADDATRFPDDRAAGVRYGAVFLEQCKRFGFPADVPHIVSVDQDIYRANIDEAEAYVRGFASQLEGRPLGIYGDDDIAYRVRDLDPVVWRPAATGWDGESRPTPLHVQQHRAISATGDGNRDIDPNTCLAPFRAWLPTDTETEWSEGGTVLYTHDRGGARLLDTRSRDFGNRPGRVKAGEVVEIPIPESAVAQGVVGRTAIFKTTVVDPSNPGHVQVTGSMFGDVGGGNFAPAAPPANAGWIAPIVDGKIRVRMVNASGHLIVDLLGVVD